VSVSSQVLAGFCIFYGILIALDGPGTVRGLPFCKDGFGAANAQPAS